MITEGKMLMIIQKSRSHCKIHLKFPWIRYPMTNAFIYWCKNTLWKTTIAKRRGIGSIINNHLMNCFVNFIRRCAWLSTDYQVFREINMLKTLSFNMKLVLFNNTSHLLFVEAKAELGRFSYNRVSVTFIYLIKLELISINLKDRLGKWLKVRVTCITSTAFMAHHEWSSPTRTRMQKELRQNLV